MNKIIATSLILTVASVSMTGCMTRSHVVTTGETAQVVAGFSQDDIDSVVATVIEKVNKASKAYAIPGKRRIINVKDITNDTLSRGRDANALAETLGQAIRENLTIGGKFIVYNETMAKNAAMNGQSVPRPEFVMFGQLKERNMRKDNGDFYKEFSLNIQLVDAATSLEFWQGRIPVRKEVDKANVMN